MGLACAVTDGDVASMSPIMLLVNLAGLTHSYELARKGPVTKVAGTNNHCEVAYSVPCLSRCCGCCLAYMWPHFALNVHTVYLQLILQASMHACSFYCPPQHTDI